MQEDKNLNNGADYSRFMPPPIPKESDTNHDYTEDTSILQKTVEDNVKNTETSDYIHHTSDQSPIHIEDTVSEQNYTDNIPPLVTQEVPRYTDNSYEVFENQIPGYNDIAPVPETNSMGLSGFILSIVAFLLFWTPIIGGILWILGLVFSCVGLAKRPKKFAIAGLIISLVGLLVFIARIFMLFVSAFSGY